MAHKTNNEEVVTGHHISDDIETRTIKVSELRMVKHKTDEETKSSKRSRTVEGYAAVYEVWSEFPWMREKIVTGAFRSALENSDIRALLNHDQNHILAREKSGTLEVWEDSKGLGFRFDIPESRDDVLEMIERGDIDECSFAFRVKKSSWVWANEEGQLDERHLEEFQEIVDISIVTYPRYDNTNVALRSKEEYRKKNQDQNWVHQIEQMEMELCLSRH